MSAAPVPTPEQQPYLDGQVVLIDKPLEWTSFDVVNKLRGSLKYRLQLKKIKVGHAGTLDPLATGLLVICTGKFTKRIDEFQASEKEYTGTIRVGASTPSFDLESEIDHTYPYEHLTEPELLAAAASLTGEIDQIPPIFSAKWVNGKRAYESARAGKEVKLEPRPVEIKAFEITRIALPDVDFRIVCSKGTYIRSIARDFGVAVGGGGHLTALRRTRNGDFHVDDAHQVDDWVAAIPNCREKEA